MFDKLSSLLDMHMQDYRSILTLCIAAIVAVLISRLIPTAFGALISIACTISCVVIFSVALINTGSLLSNDLAKADAKMEATIRESDMLCGIVTASQSSSSIEQEYGISFNDYINDAINFVNTQQEKADSEISGFAKILTKKK